MGSFFQGVSSVDVATSRGINFPKADLWMVRNIEKADPDISWFTHVLLCYKDRAGLLLTFNV